MSDNYKAIVGKVRLIPIEGAKTLQLAIYNGLTFAVDKSYTEDKLYLIFPPDGQLSEEYTTANDLLRRRDDNGKPAGGFFENNRKVRTIKLMKGAVISVGFIADLDSLTFTKGSIEDLKEGDEISEFNDVPICNKYINQATLNARGKNNQPKKKRDYANIIGFAEHQDTSQFYKSKNLLEPGDLVTVTLKLDGTSVRCGNPYMQKYNTLWNRVISKIFKANMFFNRMTTGTRRVVLDPANNASGYYGDRDMYRELQNKVNGLLLPGETLYAEIVGWLDENRPIFKRGNQVFKYGQESGTRGIYVYAIKHTSPNGYSYHLPWSLVKSRCMELGIKHVPELNFKDSSTQLIVPQYKDDSAKDSFLDAISARIDELICGADPLDPSHIREGVVIRIDKKNMNLTYFLKAKSAEYYALEDSSKLDEGFVDIEEAA